MKAEGDTHAYRVLFCEEGSKGRILLALVAFAKKMQKTPNETLKLAKRRRDEWRARVK